MFARLLLLCAVLVSLASPALAQEGRIHGMVRSYFQSNGWAASPIAGTNIIETGYEGENGKVFLRAHCLDDKRQLVVYSILPNNAPRDRRGAAMEFITRANYGLGMGNFEMDLEDGEIRFKTSVDLEGGELTPTMLETMIYLNVLTMDMYLPGLNAVMFAGVAPVDALLEVKDELETSRHGG